MSVENNRGGCPAEVSSNADFEEVASGGRDEVVALRPALVRCLCRGAVVQGMPMEVQNAQPPPVSSSNRHLTFRKRQASHAFRMAARREGMSRTELDGRESWRGGYGGSSMSTYRTLVYIVRSVSRPMRTLSRASLSQQMPRAIWGWYRCV